MSDTEIFDASIPMSAGGMRCDAALAQAFPQFSRSKLSAWLKEGKILVDGLVARPRAPVRGGEQVRLNVEVEVQIVITDDALLGISDTPARLNGYGPIPAGLARRLAATAGEKFRAWIRGLYSPLGDGRLVAMESSRRHFPDGLAAFIAARDEVCRTPWCDAPIRHTDHIAPFHAGGATTAGNGQGLCEQCNYLKEHPGWRHTAEPDGTITVRTPTGHEHHSRPPDLPHEPRRGRFVVDLSYVGSAA